MSTIYDLDETAFAIPSDLTLPSDYAMSSYYTLPSDYATSRWPRSCWAPPPHPPLPHPPLRSPPPPDGCRAGPSGNRRLGPQRPAVIIAVSALPASALDPADPEIHPARAAGSTYVQSAAAADADIPADPLASRSCSASRRAIAWRAAAQCAR